MSLKFTFGSSTPEPHDHGGSPAGIPLPFAGAASRSTSTSSTLELRVSLEGPEAVCEGFSGDGVSYARATRAITDTSAAAVAVAVRSVLARAGAELPEPLIESVSGVVVSLDGAEAAVLTELGLVVTEGADQLSSVDETLQARTGISVGTPIRAD